MLKKVVLYLTILRKKNAKTVTMSQMATENGISQIAIERTNDLLIYSKMEPVLHMVALKSIIVIMYQLEI